jgi:hypothetical protein
VRTLGTGLLIGGSIYLTAVVIWVGALIPFSRREAAGRGESYDHRRANVLRGWQLLVAIAAVLVGLWLRSA